jgi:hypothetical protein
MRQKVPLSVYQATLVCLRVLVALAAADSLCSSVNARGCIFFARDSVLISAEGLQVKSVQYISGPTI